MNIETNHKKIFYLGRYGYEIRAKVYENEFVLITISKGWIYKPLTEIKLKLRQDGVLTSIGIDLVLSEIAAIRLERRLIE